MATKNLPLEDMSPLQVEHPGALTAAGYFLIDLKLFTTVINRSNE